MRGRIEELGPWFHNLHLPDGTQTAPDHFLGDFPAEKWSELRRGLPDRLDGWRVLDIGCNAGFYSFELARMGADVVAVDSSPEYLRQARWAAKVFDLEDKVRFRHMQVYDLARDETQYDLVLFLGVFYHLRYPLLGLDIAASRTRNLFAFQSFTMPGAEVMDTCCDHDFNDRDVLLKPGWPRMAFIEHAFAGDRTNWWAPNRAAVEAMLRSTGLEIMEMLGTELYLCRPDMERPSPIRTWDRDEYLAATGLTGAETGGECERED